MRKPTAGAAGKKVAVTAKFDSIMVANYGHETFAEMVGAETWPPTMALLVSLLQEG